MASQIKRKDMPYDAGEELSETEGALPKPRMRAASMHI